ncbi:hypothetical protein [Siphonobacter sp.]|uniref:hypothetical protein n=1 Tax=Siphonobacter sp. TaxID=1869184 RepID=UPI003B3BAF99
MSRKTYVRLNETQLRNLIKLTRTEFDALAAGSYAWERKREELYNLEVAFHNGDSHLKFNHEFEYALGTKVYFMENQEFYEATITSREVCEYADSDSIQTQKLVKYGISGGRLKTQYFRSGDFGKKVFINRNDLLASIQFSKPPRIL